MIILDEKQLQAHLNLFTDAVSATGSIVTYRTVGQGGTLAFVTDEGETLEMNGLYTHWDSYESLRGKHVKVWFTDPDTSVGRRSQMHKILFFLELKDSEPALLSEQDFRRIAAILGSEP